MVNLTVKVDSMAILVSPRDDMWPLIQVFRAGDNTRDRPADCTVLTAGLSFTHCFVRRRESFNELNFEF